MTIGLDDIAAWLKAHAEDPLVKRAHLLAQGRGSLEDKRDHLEALIRMAKGTATPLPYDPRRHLSTEVVDKSPARDVRARECLESVEEVRV